MNICKLMYAADGYNKENTILVFKYRGMYFTAGYNYDNRPYCTLEEDIFMLLPLLGSIETRLPDLRFITAQDYKDFSALIQHVDQTLRERQAEVDKYVDDFIFRNKSLIEHEHLKDIK